jgi:hypothetical protein
METDFSPHPRDAANGQLQTPTQAWPISSNYTLQAWLSLLQTGKTASILSVAVGNATFVFYWSRKANFLHRNYLIRPDFR